MSNGANINAADSDGKTALMRAAQLGNDTVVQALIDAGTQYGIKISYLTQQLIPFVRFQHVINIDNLTLLKK